MMTPEYQKFLAMQEPVYREKTRVYSESVAGRLHSAAAIEGLMKGEHWQAGAWDHSYPAQNAPALHETIQSVYARVKLTTQSVGEMQTQDGTFNMIPGV